MAGFFRIKVSEKDISGFVRPIVDETGAMVVDSFKGRADIPTYIQSDSDAILYFGLPNAEKFGMFEAISYSRQAPMWLVRAIGAGAKFAGIDISSTVESFGTRTGRDIDTFNPGAVSTNAVETIGTGDGITVAYTGTLANTPITSASYMLYTGTDLRDSAESGGTITGADATGTLNLATGAYAVTFTGTGGTAAQFDSSIDLSAGVDLSIGGKNKAIKLTIDQTIFDNLDLGVSPTTTRSAIITAINTAVGYTAATTLGAQYIRITAQYGSTSLGQIKIEAPSDTLTYDSGVNLVFATTPASLTHTTAPTNPTGAVPKAGQSVKIDYIYTQSVTTTLSHSFYTYSQFDDSFEQYAASVAYKGGSKYTITLYKVIPTKGNSLIDSYDYSLIREKDNFGRSLYYKDVFKYNPYLRIYVNPSYTGLPADPSNSTDIVLLTGGNKGAAPLTSDYNAAWAHFEKANKFPAKIFMDVYGGYAGTLANIIQNYQRYSMGLSMVIPGNNAAGAVLYRQSVGIDYDHLAMYTNWATIVDPYNNSFAFTSQIGKIGAKWAAMQDVYDGLPPAGTDENNHGGQLDNTTFQVVEMEFDYTETEKENLDNAQLNPIILDPVYGPIVEGNRTLQVALSDTSYIHTRRIYNFILDNAEKQVLRKQVFKLNDDLHRVQVKTQIEAIVLPLVDSGLLREAVVVCDDSNNTDAVLDQRKFVVDVYVKATPDSEFVVLSLVRVSQTTVISSIIGTV